jgi:hypothetical protein
MKDPVPGKRRLLTQMALFWFDKLHALVVQPRPGSWPVQAPRGASIL